MSKGIDVSHLLDSKVFNVNFDLDDWPSSHYNEAKVLKPYNGSIFNLRFKYKELFPEEDFAPMEDKI